MREIFITALKLVAADRLMVSLLVLLILLSSAYSLYVGVSLHPGSLQVAIRYTSFGETNYYRDQWYYLITFVMFGGIIAIGHSLIAMKLYVQQKRKLAIAFTLFSYSLLLIAVIIAHSVLRIAFL